MHSKHSPSIAFVLFQTHICLERTRCTTSLMLPRCTCRPRIQHSQSRLLLPRICPGRIHYRQWILIWHTYQFDKERRSHQRCHTGQKLHCRLHLRLEMCFGDTANIHKSWCCLLETLQSMQTPGSYSIPDNSHRAPTLARPAQAWDGPAPSAQI